MGRGIKLADIAFLGRVGNQFSPMSFANIAGWLRADVPGFPLIDGTLVGDPGTQWLDQSGNGRDASNSGSGKPTLELGEVNGKPVIRFDSLGELLGFPELSFTGDFTVIFVGRTTVGADTIWFGHASDNDQLRRNVGGGNDAASYAGSGFHQSTAFSGLSSVFQMTTWRRSGTTFSWRQNKTARSTASEAVQTLRINTICNNPFLSSGRGDAGEIVFYTAHRSDAEVDQLFDQWFQSRWAL